MPPRGYRRPTGPTIGAQVRKKKSAVDELIRERVKTIADILREELDRDPITATPLDHLADQHVPKGTEPITEIPLWAGHFGHRKTGVKHAVKISGTNHIIMSRTELTNKQLDNLTRDYQKAMIATGHMYPEGVALYVPDAKTERIPQRAHGWVQMDNGKTRVFSLRPSIARNDNAAKIVANNKAFRDRNYTAAQNMNKYTRHAGTKGQELKPKSAPIWGHTMPASEKVETSGRIYTMIHELGHVHDNIHNHTGGTFGAMQGKPDGVWKVSKADGSMSRYGTTNQQEGYAEAFAQYFLGGKGSNKASDRYARVYSWRLIGTHTQLPEEEVVTAS
jgi:hypothetical protein